MVEQLNQVSEKIKIVLPLHPRTKAKLEQFSLLKNFPLMLSSLIQLDILSLQQSSSIIITDSGGMQKEAFFRRDLVLPLGQKPSGLNCWLMVTIV